VVWGYKEMKNRMVYLLDFGRIDGVRRRACNKNMKDCSLTGNKKEKVWERWVHDVMVVGFGILDEGESGLNGRNIWWMNSLS